MNCLLHHYNHLLYPQTSRAGRFDNDSFLKGDDEIDMRGLTPFMAMRG